LTTQYPSIFNDVIGPVMRGPSSSHLAAAARIGLMARQLIDGKLTKVITRFDSKGSLATTYNGHGSDIGLIGGLLGFKPDNDNIVNSLKEAPKRGIEVVFKIEDYNANHPNTYKLTLINDTGINKNIVAISLGGGMVEIINIDDLNISIQGDYYETLIFMKDIEQDNIYLYTEKIKKYFKNIEKLTYAKNGNSYLINVKSNQEIEPEIIDKLYKIKNIYDVKQISPVLPVMSRNDTIIPFNTAEEMLKLNSTKNLDMWELGILFEGIRGNLKEDKVFSKMSTIVEIMDSSIRNGLKGTDYKDRILGPQARIFKESEKTGMLIPVDILNNVIAYTMAVMEVKSSMGLIVAAPTAGACGVIPGTIIGTADKLNSTQEQITKSILAAGVIGILICKHATFAGEEAGCQAECGSASSMAAAGLVQLMGGTVEQGLKAASIALQNVLGLVCDPVGNRVEVPCLGRNIMGASNAIASANMALAGIDEVVPLDEVIDSMHRIGDMLPSELRCTGLGGLSLTETSKRIEKELEKNKISVSSIKK
jgi:L-serine dehydratase